MKLRLFLRKLRDIATLMKCVATCRTEPAEWDKDVNQWRCSKCGAKWGDTR